MARPTSLVVLGLVLAACATPERQGPSFATGFSVPESDGILIEWRACAKDRPCIDGDWDGRRYALGFDESPAVLVGKLGGEAVRLELDPASVYRLGDHAIDMLFTDKARRTTLTLTWNELEQKPIDSSLVTSDTP